MTYWKKMNLNNNIIYQTYRQLYTNKCIGANNDSLTYSGSFVCRLYADYILYRGGKNPNQVISF